MDAENMVAVEVWVMVDEDGNFVAECKRETLKERYESDVGELDGMLATRTVCITVNVPKPKPVELVATVATEVDNAELKAV